MRIWAAHVLKTGMAVFSRARIVTLVAALIGASVFVLAGLPLPLLLGPMLGCLAFALAGAALQGMGTVGTFFRTFLGVAIGSTVTPEMIATLPSHGPTLALMPVFVLVIGLVGYPFFRKVMGYDHATAFYSAMPGGLQDMLIFGEEAGGNVRAMSLIHATRVLAIVTVAPVLLTLLYDLDLTRAPGASASSFPVWDIALMIVAGVAGWKGGERIGLFGASILGPLIVTAGLSLAGDHPQSATSRDDLDRAVLHRHLGRGEILPGSRTRELRHDVLAGAGLCGDAGVPVASCSSNSRCA